MEACLGVEREVVKVLDKFTNLRDQNVRNIDELLTIVRNAKTELQNGKHLLYVVRYKSVFEYTPVILGFLIFVFSIKSILFIIFSIYHFKPQ